METAGGWERVAVETGATTPEGVEIVAGLVIGDTVRLP